MIKHCVKSIPNKQIKARKNIKICVPILNRQIELNLNKSKYNKLIMDKRLTCPKVTLIAVEINLIKMS